MGTNGGMSIECWIKPTNFNVAPIVEYNSGAAIGCCFWIFGNSQSVAFDPSDTSGTDHWVYAPANLLTTSAFQHIAATYDTNTGNVIVCIITERRW